MRWKGHRTSKNVEDRRNLSAPAGGSGPRIPRGKGSLILLIIVVVAGFFGYDLSTFLDGGSAPFSGQLQQGSSPREAEDAKFSSVIFAFTEDLWQSQFKASGATWKPAKLVLYRDYVTTGCGMSESAMGPFYCPADSKVYIDLSFYDDMQHKLGAGGEFAQGYVIAHEVGHHVQNLLGDWQKLNRMQYGVSVVKANQLSVKYELQADCYAGFWGHYMQQRGILEPGDLQQALDAAAASGDDRLQARYRDSVVPDSFTHGTSAQRYYWFKRGYDSGDPASCNTFQ